MFVLQLLLMIGNQQVLYILLLLVYDLLINRWKEALDLTSLKYRKPLLGLD